MQKPILLAIAGLLLAPLALPGQALAQTPLPLPTPAPSTQPAARTVGLRDTIALAVQQNRTLKSAESDIAVAVAKQYTALGNEDLLLNGQANVTARRSQPLPNAQFQQLEFTDVHTEFSASKPLWFGGRIGVRASHDYSNTKTRISLSAATFDERQIDEFNPTVQLTYYMPLLRGFGEEEMRAARTRAAAAKDVAVLTRENLVAGVIRDVILAYWELAYAAQNVEILRSSLDLAREQLRITQARLDVGVGAPTDVAAVRQGIATRESDVLLAELALAERGIDLRQLAGMDIRAGEIELLAADKLEVTPEPIDLEAAMNAAYANNAQLAILAAQGKSATLEIQIAEYALKPQLDLSANFGPSGNAETVGAALERMAQFKDYQVFAGLTFAYPVGNHAAEGARRAALAQREKVVIPEDDLRRQIAVSVAKTVNLVRSTDKRMQADREAVELGQINLDAEKARFEVGRSTNFDVLRRQDELAQARLRLTRDVADYMKAVATLQTLTGELLPAYGITVKRTS